MGVILNNVTTMVSKNFWVGVWAICKDFFYNIVNLSLNKVISNLLYLVMHQLFPYGIATWLVTTR